MNDEMNNGTNNPVKFSTIFFSGERSPCIGVCRCNQEDICIGCGRSRDDIKEWMNMTDEQKRECKKKSAQRLITLHHDNTDAYKKNIRYPEDRSY